MMITLEAKSTATMKNTILLLTSLAVTFFAFGQDSDWFAAGTTWTYNYSFNPAGPGVPGTANVDFTISEQTTLNGTECSKMDVPEGEDNPFTHFAVTAPYYFYTSGDSVFYATDYDPTFRLGFDFGAQPGDSRHFIVPVEMFQETDTFLVTVDAFSTTMIDGEELRVLDLTYENISPVAHTWILQDPISISVTERLGSPVLFFLPVGEAGGEISAVEGPFNISLRCYSSPSLQYLNPDFDTCLLSTADAARNSELRVYPNPVRDLLHISIPDGQHPIEAVEIYDTRGRLVLEFTNARTSSEGVTLNVRSLRSGVYVVRARSKGTVYAQKAVIGAY